MPRPSTAPDLGVCERSPEGLHDKSVSWIPNTDEILKLVMKKMNLSDSTLPTHRPGAIEGLASALQTTLCWYFLLILLMVHNVIFLESSDSLLCYVGLSRFIPVLLCITWAEGSLILLLYFNVQLFRVVRKDYSVLLGKSNHTMHHHLEVMSSEWVSLQLFPCSNRDSSSRFFLFCCCLRAYRKLHELQLSASLQKAAWTSVVC